MPANFISGQSSHAAGPRRPPEYTFKIVHDYPHDPADAGSNLAESDRAEAILAAAKARRLLVLDALVRLENGSYGVCVDCGKPVPEGRLEVKPEAARCLACQAKRDRMRR